MQSIDACFRDDEVNDKGVAVIAEVEAGLEQLYDCQWGTGESLKRFVVAIQSQVNSAVWTRSHVAFVRDALQFLRVRDAVNDATVKHCINLIKEHGLDPFRGSVAEPTTSKQNCLEDARES